MVRAAAVQRGGYTATERDGGDGTLLLDWDNSHSTFRGKDVDVEVRVLAPGAEGVDAVDATDPGTDEAKDEPAAATGAAAAPFQVGDVVHSAGGQGVVRDTRAAPGDDDATEVQVEPDDGGDAAWHRADALWPARQPRPGVVPPHLGQHIPVTRGCSLSALGLDKVAGDFDLGAADAPEGSLSEAAVALVREAMEGIGPEGVTDYHCHIVGCGDCGSGTREKSALPMVELSAS